MSWVPIPPVPREPRTGELTRSIVPRCVGGPPHPRGQTFLDSWRPDSPVIGVREIASQFQEMPMLHQMPDASSARLMTYEDLADWLNDSVRNLRRLVDEKRIP